MSDVYDCKQSKFDLNLFDRTMTYFNKIDREPVRFHIAIASIALIVAAFVYLVLAGWQKWGDLIIDSSREMWVPLLINQGKALYRDIYYFHGPLPAHTLALLYRGFGTSLDTLIGCGIVTAMLMCIAMYKLSKLFFDQVVSTVIVLNFCFVFAFGVTYYETIANYAFPYSFASTFCMLFIVTATYLFIRYLESRSLIYILAWGYALTLASLCRLETTIAVWIAFIICSFLDKKWHVLTKSILLLQPIILTTVIYYIFLYNTHSFQGFKDSMIGSVLFALQGKDSFPIITLGIDAVEKNLLLLAKSSFSHLILLSSIYLSAYLVNKFIVDRKFWFLLFGIIIFVAAIVYACVYLRYPDDQFRCIPLILTLSCMVYIFNIFTKPYTIENIKLLAINLIALSLVFKIYLNCTIFPYGFYLLNLGLICYYIFLFNIVNLFNSKYIKVDSMVINCLMVILLTALFLRSWVDSYHIYTNKIYKVNTGKGVIYSFDDERTHTYWSTLKYLMQNSKEGDSLIVFPEGASLNYFTGLSNPLKYILFYPGDISKIGEDKMIEEIRRHKITYITIISCVDKDMLAFGEGYGVALASWIRKNYEYAAEFSETNPYDQSKFWMLTLKRKESSITASTRAPRYFSDQ